MKFKKFKALVHHKETESRVEVDGLGVPGSQWAITRDLANREAYRITHAPTGFAASPRIRLSVARAKLEKLETLNIPVFADIRDVPRETQAAIKAITFSLS